MTVLDTVVALYNDARTALANKIIDLASNTLTGTTAQFNVANTDADFYTTNGTDVAVSDGGTGVSTLTGIVKGNGTSPFTPAAAGADYTAPLIEVVKQTANYTATGNQIVPMDATSGVITGTFPTAPPDGTRVVFKKVDSSTNAVNLALGGSDVFNLAGGTTTGSLQLQNQAMQAQYDAAHAIWYVISTDVPLSGLDARYTAARLIVSVTSSTTLGSAANTDYVALIGASGAPILPTAVGNKNRYTCKNVTTSAITVSTTSAQTIDGVTTVTIPPNNSSDFISDNSNWWII